MPAKREPTPDDVAAWMLQQFRSKGELYQEDAVTHIQREFGDPFVYENANGNLAIGKDVLKSFRRISEDSVMWERGERYWRRRTPRDPKGQAAGRLTGGSRGAPAYGRTYGKLYLPTWANTYR